MPPTRSILLSPFFTAKDTEKPMTAKRPLPQTPDQWLDEIETAFQDAAEAKPFGVLTGGRITDADLFHMAPLVCLKFRGRNLKGQDAKKVTEAALASYVANEEAKCLRSQPRLAFALCYVVSHFALDLLDEESADKIMQRCEERFLE